MKENITSHKNAVYFSFPFPLTAEVFTQRLPFTKTTSTSSITSVH